MNKQQMPRVLAIYLPQFHETEDNNQWWGKGFTDWESVKRAEPCFEGHMAPWKPLNNNYYDLSEISTLKWQADLALRYGINGFSFYHYYFKDGKKELEKPAEILLNHPEIEIPFCFNWASESWIRSWSKISGNVWSEKFENAEFKADSGILVEQDYGEEKEWIEHFNYLLPFFKDKRYIKMNDKPIFIFYRPSDIKCLDKMVKVWKKLAVDAGLGGIYFIGVNVNAALINLDASLIYEPRNAINRMNEQVLARNIEGVRCFEYSDAWEAVLKSQPYKGSKTFFTGISGYDDTPRRGKSGECLINNSPEIFQANLESLLIKSIQYGNELVFINAWNEWGEGIYLEPDEEHAYEYLNAIYNAKKNIKTDKIVYQDAENIDDVSDEEKKALLYDVEKYKTFLEIFDKWLYLKRDNKFNIAEYLKSKGIESVAIYGLGIIGKQLYNELLCENLKVAYGIDRYVGQYGDGLAIKRPEDDKWEAVDAIIITAYEEDMVYDFVKSKTEANVLRLSEIIENLWREQ